MARPDADAAEGDETVIIRAGAEEAQLTITDGPSIVVPPSVVSSVTASPDSISEDGDTSTVTVTLDRATQAGSQAFAITFRGSATRDTDFTATIRLRDVFVKSALAEVRRKASTALLRRNSKRFSDLTGDVVASRLNGGRFSRANEDGQRAGPWNVWASLSGSKLRGDAEGTARDVYIGGDVLLAPDTTVGVLGSYEASDLTTQADVAGAHDSTGWSVGGYFGTRLSDNLLFNLSASYGRFSPELSAVFQDEAISADYDANRYLISGNLTGNFAYGNFTVSPRLGFVYAREDQSSFTDTSGAVGLSDKLELGRVSFGPTVSYDFDLASEYGSLGISATATGFADFVRPDEEDALSLAVRMGLNWEAPSGLSIRLDGGYDGIGLDDYKSLDGSVSVGLKF